ncbi:MAG TPA: transcriptional repressor [Candidatus Binataceae bacterium]|nr:transcriptional repressor [Candidatus Binataceae bacterium]
MKVQMVTDTRRAGYAAGRMAEFAERCHRGGLAVTPQRLAIIRALLCAADHPRAEAIYAAVRREHPHISLATVHRTLETLCRIGEARKVTALHDSARYDGNTAPHHHVVCVGCRRIRDIEIPGIERLLDGRHELGEFRLLGWALEVHALCGDCQRGKKTTRTNQDKQPS